MLAELHTFLTRHQLNTKPMVVAVSGGVDSLVLLHLLTRCCERSRLVVAHLNHQLRGVEAEADAIFVGETAAMWEVSCVLDSADVPTLIQQHGYTIEEAARRARYQFLADVAHKHNATAILTAHHADDQAETVLMNLLRGSGLTGLRGMQPISPVPYALDEQLKLVRPLLNVRRHMIESYAATHQLRPRFDRTNEDVTLRRNRVRLELIPSLLDVSPQLPKHLLHLSELAAADNALLDRLTADAWRDLVRSETAQLIVLQRSGWQQLPLSLRRRILRRAVAKLEVGFATLEQARHVAETGQTGASAPLAAQWRLRVAYDMLRFEQVGQLQSAEIPQWTANTPLHLAVPSEVSMGAWVISAELIPFQPTFLHNQDPWQAYLAPHLAHDLWIRTRRAGERMQPLGLGSKHKKLKRIMIDRKLPAEQRSRWPIVATGQHVIWVVGHLLDERGRISAENQQVVWLRCYRRKT